MKPFILIIIVSAIGLGALLFLSFTYRGTPLIELTGNVITAELVTDELGAWAGAVNIEFTIVERVEGTSSGSLTLKGQGTTNFTKITKHVEVDSSYTSRMRFLLKDIQVENPGDVYPLQLTFAPYGEEDISFTSQLNVVWDERQASRPQSLDEFIDIRLLEDIDQLELPVEAKQMGLNIEIYNSSDFLPVTLYPCTVILTAERDWDPDPFVKYFTDSCEGVEVGPGEKKEYRVTYMISELNIAPSLLSMKDPNRPGTDSIPYDYDQLFLEYKLQVEVTGYVHDFMDGVSQKFALDDSFHFQHSYGYPLQDYLP